jgi:hypothetical protein
MRSADFGGLDVEERVALEGAVVAAVDRAGEEDLLTRVAFQLLH